MYLLETWWRHRKGTFTALLALCAGISPVTDELSSQRPVTRSFDVFFYLCLYKRFSKQSRHRWFETPLHSLWRHCNEFSPLQWTPSVTIMETYSAASDDKVSSMTTPRFQGWFNILSINIVKWTHIQCISSNTFEHGNTVQVFSTPWALIQYKYVSPVSEIPLCTWDGRLYW